MAPDQACWRRSIRNHKPLRDERVTLSAVDPLALGGVAMPGTKTAAIERNRVVFVTGVVVDGDGRDAGVGDAGVGHLVLSPVL